MGPPSSEREAQKKVIKEKDWGDTQMEKPRSQNFTSSEPKFSLIR